MSDAARDRMLNRIRDGLVRNRETLAAIARQAPQTPPPFVHPRQDDPVAQFIAEATRLEARCHRCADDEEALETLRELLQACNTRTLVSWDLAEIGLPGLELLLRELAIDVNPGAGVRAGAIGALAQAEVGLSGVHGAIAESGTLVVSSGPGTPRMASLLAPTHIAIVRATQIRRGLGEVLAALQANGDPLTERSSLVFISGPSRTGDIELTLTLGVHGPRSVQILVIG